MVCVCVCVLYTLSASVLHTRIFMQLLLDFTAYLPSLFLYHVQMERRMLVMTRQVPVLG